MSTYIDDADIQRTMKGTRWSELTADDEALDFAIDQANSEIKSIIGIDYDSLNDVPENVRKHGGIIGRYHLYSFNEVVDPEDTVRVDYEAAVKHLREMAAGREYGLDDPASTADDPIRKSSRERFFDPWLNDERE